MKLSTTLSTLLLAGGIFAQTSCAAPTARQIVKPEPPANDLGPVHSYILLDRTGSMRGIWDETLSSVNAYVDELGKPNDDGGTLESQVTLSAFDYQDGFQFDVLREGVTPQNWVGVSDQEVSPRGMTPLFDAIGQIISLAEVDAAETVVIVIMTDGKENASKELDAEDAKNALDRAKGKGWEIVFLGADFAAFGDARAVGISNEKSMAISPEQLEVAQRSLANKVKGYAKDKDAKIIFNEEDRARAGEDNVIDRKGQ